MKRFIKHVWHWMPSIVTAGVFIFLLATLKGESREVLDVVMSLIAPIGYFYGGVMFIRWYRNRQPMSIIYNKDTDEGVMFVVPRSKKYVPLRPEALVDGVVFNYHAESGELHSVYVQGVNKKNEEDQK